MTSTKAETKNWVFVGGYGSTIETFELDPGTGTLTSSGLTDGVAEAPTFLALDEARQLLFAVSERGGADAAQPGRAVSFRIDAATGKLSQISEVWAGGSNAVHVALTHSGRYLLTASSSTLEGRVAVIPVAADGTLSEPTDSQIAGKNAHGLVQSPDGQFVYVVCRGEETVAKYRLDESTGKLLPLRVPRVALPAPSGPRHIAAHPTEPVVYVLNDWSGEIIAYRYATDGLLSVQQAISVFPPGKQPQAVKGSMTAAEIEVSRDGKRVYASTRTPSCQSLAVLDVNGGGRLTLVANEEARGLIQGPRHFISSRDGSLMVLANQDNDTLLVFKVDEANGRPSLLGASTPTRVKQPNALAFGVFKV
jgi:6-phosphogluconolactonase